MAQSDYGDLQGSSLQSQELPSSPFANPSDSVPTDLLVDVSNESNSQQKIVSPVAISSPDSTNPFASVPSQPEETVSDRTPPDRTDRELVLANCKGALMEFCGKNKLRLPVFTREPPVASSYKVSATWSPHNSDECFEEKAIFPNRREAENSVARKMLQRIQVWHSNNWQAEIGDTKGQLNQLLSKNSSIFLQLPKYNTTNERIGSCFNCQLIVTDSTSEEHVTEGRGVSKKMAEKDAAGKMVPLVEEMSRSRKSGQCEGFNNDIEKLEATRARSFPTYQIEYRPCNQQNEGMRYLLQSCSLILRKENAPAIVVATCSGLQLEQAKLACAKLALQHTGNVIKVINSKPK